MIFVYDGKKILNKHRGFLFDQMTTLEFSGYCSLIRLLFYTKHIYFSKSIPVVDGVSK